MAGLGRARYQPIWADDVADCVVAALDAPAPTGTRATSWPGPTCSRSARSSSWPCAPPTAAAGSCPCPRRVLRPLLRGYEALTGPAALATWEEAELLGITMRTPRGTADAEALGVHPRHLAAVLGA